MLVSGFAAWQEQVSPCVTDAKLSSCSSLRQCQSDCARALREEAARQRGATRANMFAQLTAGAGKTGIIGLLTAGILRDERRQEADVRQLVLAPLRETLENLKRNLFSPSASLFRWIGLSQQQIDALQQRVVLYRQGLEQSAEFSRSWVRQEGLLAAGE